MSESSYETAEQILDSYPFRGDRERKGGPWGQVAEDRRWELALQEAQVRATLALAEASSPAGAAGKLLRVGLTPQTPNLIGKPGIELLTIEPGTLVLEDWWFTQTAWDGNNPTLYADTDLYPDVNSNGIYQMNDWQNDGKVSTGDYLLSGSRPKLWTQADKLRVYVADDQGQGADPGASEGLVVVTLRVSSPSS